MVDKGHWALQAGGQGFDLSPGPPLISDIAAPLEPLVITELRIIEMYPTPASHLTVTYIQVSDVVLAITDSAMVCS